ncbi:hypothetical protein J7E71_17375 [Mesobacillus foraminis]|uniref:hypothetical protein n=1 Tax=Mesobacillus foraminis TaxID=279826 RepID=UPI001BEA8B47|nr:hypothetical protein [Mesobacillus foraminis]MBT2757663.1 hypothetical protein [Mesobacillus foraminis]
MKPFSIFSFGFIVLGLLLFEVNWIMEGYTETIVLLGFVSLCAGIVLSFIAIAKQEEGILKFISLISFFIILFLTTWFQPLDFIRITTWLSNIN